MKDADAETDPGSTHGVETTAKGAKTSLGSDPHRLVRKSQRTADGLRWGGVELKNYKEEGTHFKAITRQNLFTDEDDQPCELRYFEIQPGGHSTFEKHVHTHSIIVLFGRGRAVVGETVASIEAFDLVQVPSLTWHQLQAAEGEALGFVCQVPCDRDRPTRPTNEEREELLAHPAIGEVIRL